VLGEPTKVDPEAKRRFEEITRGKTGDNNGEKVGRKNGDKALLL